MKNVHRIILVISLAYTVCLTEAQNVSPVDFMRNNTKPLFANPAAFTPDDFYFDIVLGNLNFDFQNTGLKYDNFFDFDANGYPVMLNINKGIAGLGKTNYLNSSFSLDVLSFGFRTKHGFFTFNHRIHEQESLVYSKDMLQLIFNGNAAFLGQDNPADLNLGLNFRAFHDINLGWQMCLTDKLNVGLRLKFLMGLADAQANVNAQLYTDPDSYALRLTAGADGRATLPFCFVTPDGEIDYNPEININAADLFGNYGGGIDFGAEYQINDRWSVAAAVNDLGWISWKSYPERIKAGLADGGAFYQDNGIVFEGLTDEQIDGIMNDPDYLSHLTDSLMDYVSYDVSVVPYASMLNTSAMVRGNFDLTPNHRFSAQLLGYYTGFGIRPAATVAYTGSFNKRYDVVATYTIMPGSYDNIGIGLSANFGVVHLFVASNNVLAFVNPVNSTQLNFRLGISFTSITKTDRKDTIVIMERGSEE